MGEVALSLAVKVDLNARCEGEDTILDEKAIKVRISELIDSKVKGVKCEKLRQHWRIACFLERIIEGYCSEMVFRSMPSSA